MMTLAGLILLRAEAGAQILDEFAALHGWQMEAYWDDLQPLCPSRVVLEPPRRSANALNVEVGAPAPRCADRSPDGRGLAWALSGGSYLAYGHCDYRACPRRRVA